MILWKIEKPNNSKRKIANSKTTQITNQQPQFQDGTYEKVLVMLKINKQKVLSKGKVPAGKTQIKITE